jgi:hypothetical protein
MAAHVIDSNLIENEEEAFFSNSESCLCRHGLNLKERERSEALLDIFEIVDSFPGFSQHQNGNKVYAYHLLPANGECMKKKKKRNNTHRLFIGSHSIDWCSGMHHVQGHTSLSNCWGYTVTKKEKESKKRERERKKETERQRERERDVYIRQFFADQPDTVSYVFATYSANPKNSLDQKLF